MTFTKSFLQTNYSAEEISCRKLPPQQHESEKCLATARVDADPSVKFRTVLQAPLHWTAAAPRGLWRAAPAPSARGRQRPVSSVLAAARGSSQLQPRPSLPLRHPRGVSRARTARGNLMAAVIQTVRVSPARSQVVACTAAQTANMPSALMLRVQPKPGSNCTTCFSREIKCSPAQRRLCRYPGCNGSALRRPAPRLAHWPGLASPG